MLKDLHWGPKKSRWIPHVKSDHNQNSKIKCVYLIKHDPKLNWKWTGCFSNGNVWKETIGPTICSLCFRNITRYSYHFLMYKIRHQIPVIFFSLVVSSWFVSQVCWSISLYSTLAELPFTFRIQIFAFQIEENQFLSWRNLLDFTDSEETEPNKNVCATSGVWILR